MTPDSETIQIQTTNYNITRQRHALVLLIIRALLIPEGFITLRIPQLLSDAAPLEPVQKSGAYSTRSTANKEAAKQHPSVGHHL